MHSSNISREFLTFFENFSITIKNWSIDLKMCRFQIDQSRYLYPFLERNDEIDWFIHIVIETPYGEDDRGYVYFHDILNHHDLRELTNPDGTFIEFESITVSKKFIQFHILPI